MLIRQSTLLLAVLATLAQPVGHAQNDAVRLLLEQGQYWQKRGDDQRAAEAWEKLLRADADQPDALYGLGLIALRQQRLDLVDDYIRRLRRQGDERLSRLLEQELALQTPAASGQIDKARQALEADDLDTAVESYRQALGNRQPEGELALEYYQTLAATDSGWDTARSGLERLVREDPGNAQARLALAEMLTYREATRREGVRQLQALARDPQVGQLANERWTTGLEWLGDPADPQDAGLYEAYLAANPDNTALRARYDALRKSIQASQAAVRRAAAPPPLDPTAQALARAFRALEGKQLDTAEEQFKAILEQRPRQAEALGGMGLLRLRQERFADAANLLQQASEAGNARRWQSALRSARYWTLVHDAETLRSQEQYDLARVRLEQAIALDNREVAGRLALATLQTETGQAESAAVELRRLANQHPRNHDVIGALVLALAQLQRYDEAQTWFERLPATAQQELKIGPVLRLGQAQASQRAAVARGDLQGNRQALREIVELNPEEPWPRLELLRAELQLDNLAGARQQADRLRVSYPDDPEFQEVATIATREIRSWEIQQARERAQALGQHNDFAARRQALDDLIRLDPDDPWNQLELVRLELSQGNLVQAKRIADELRATQPQNPDALHVGDLMRDEIRVVELAQTQEQAQAAALQGDAEGQRTALEAAARLAPGDAWIRLDLARLEQREGNMTKANEWVEAPLRANPDDLDARYASALFAAETGQWPLALQRLEALPDSQLSEPLLNLKRQARLQTELARANELTSQGQEAAARSLLRSLEPQADRSEWQMAVADAYAKAGDPARSLAILRPLLRTEVAQPSGLWLQYAAVLAETSQDAELAVVLDRLQGMTLTEQERAGLHDLQIAHAARQADGLRQRGELAAAYDELAPWLTTDPDNTLLTSTLARLYADAGEPAQALELLRPLQQNQPDDLPLLLATANAALQAGELRYAGRMADAAIALQPDSAEAQSTAARIYQAQGRRGEAIRALEAAIALERSPGRAAAPKGGLAPSPGQPAPYHNPFAGKRGPAPAPGSSTPLSPALPAPSWPSGGAQALPPLPPPAAIQPSGSPLAGPFGLPDTAAAIPALQAPQPLAPWPTTPVAAPGWAPPASPLPYAATGLPPLPSGAVNRPSLAAVAPVRQSPSLPPLPPSTAGATQPVATSPLPLEQQLQTLRAEFSGSASGGALVRHREGESGMSAYTGVELPLEARLPVGNGKVALRITPMTVDAGSVGGDYNTSSRFGGGPAAALAEADGRVGRAGKQQDSGVGVSIAYEGENLQADVGSTPLGMQQTNIVGGVSVNARFANGLNAGATVSRRAVTDSLLSFAGTKDERTDERWGGVTSTGGQLELGYDGGNWGLYGHAGWHALRGHNVVNNTRIDGSLGVYSHLSRDDDHEVTVGLNLTGMGYDQNLRYFTYGHGGYFSPQRFVSLAVPMSWTQREGKLRFGLSGSIGVQNFKEDAARYFPGNEARQAQAQVAAAEAAERGLTSNPSAMYEGQTKTGLGYGVAAAAEYQFAPQWFVGGNISANNARDYREWQGGLYVRYQFSPSMAPPPLPLSPLKSSYQR